VRQSAAVADITEESFVNINTDVDYISYIEQNIRFGKEGVSVYGEINDKWMTIILDTGSTRSCLNSKYLEAGAKILPYYGKLIAANNTRLNTRGLCICNVSILGYVTEFPFVIVEGVDFPCIVGVDFMRSQKIIIDFERSLLLSDHLDAPICINNITETSERQFLFQTLTGDVIENNEFNIYSAEELIIKPKQTVTLNVNIKRWADDKDFIFQPSPWICEKLCCECLNFVYSKNKVGNDTIILRNNGILPVKIYCGQAIGYTESLNIVDNCKFVEELNESDEENIACSVKYGWGEYLQVDESEYDAVFTTQECDTRDETIHSAEELDISREWQPLQYRRILNVLQNNIKVFSWSNSDFTKMNIEPIKIEVVDNEPVRSKPFRYSYKEREIIDKIIKDLLEADIIEPSRSNYAANVVIVKKHDSGYRMCQDFRLLNVKKIKFIVQPTPYIEDLLHYLESGSCFSSVDLRNSFYVIPLHPESRPITAFRTHDNLYQYKSLPMGLNVSTQIFSRVLADKLADFIPHTIIQYCDDFTIFSCGVDSMINKLDAVLKRFIEINCKLKASKCHFAYSSCKIYGFLIDKDGIRVDPSRVECLLKIEIPTTLSGTRAILGMLSYYRRFISGFAQIVHPVTELLKKSDKFVMTDEAAAALQKAKEALAQNTLLTHFVPGCKIRVETDGSLLGVAAALFIEKEGQWCPVSFASRKLSQNEKSWPPLHIELLALGWGCRSFRHYLFDVEFEFVVDAKPLIWIVPQEKPNVRLLKLCLDLQEFKFSITHKSGKTHLGVDYFSRYPIWPAKERNDENEENMGLTQINHIEEIDFRAEQVKDPNLRQIIEALQGQDMEAVIHRKARSYLLEDDLLFRKNYAHFGARKLLVVPAHLINRVLISFHDEPYGGAHYAVYKTFRKIAEKYYFDNMRNEVTRFVKSCWECQTKKRPIRQPQGFLQPSQHERIFESIYIDFYGPVGNKGTMRYIHTAMCGFSRFTILKACANCNATSAADFIMNDIVCVFGIPQKIISDQGTAYTSSIIKELTERIGCKITHATAHHPITIGMLERSHANLALILSSFINETHSNWHKFVKLAQWGMNAVPNESTGMSPYFLVFGEMPRFPLDINFDLPFEHFENRDWLDNLKKARDSCKERLAKMRQRMSARYNKNRTAANYHIGQKVLIYFPQNIPGKVSKFLRKYRGVYTVIRKLSELNYEVKERAIRGKTFVVHVDRMKPFFSRPGYLTMPRPKIRGPKQKLYLLDYD